MLRLSRGERDTNPLHGRSHFSHRLSGQHALRAGASRFCADERRNSPGRTRTYNLAVNSRSLCRLSYRGMRERAPFRRRAGKASGRAPDVLEASDSSVRLAHELVDALAH